MEPRSPNRKGGDREGRIVLERRGERPLKQPRGHPCFPQADPGDSGVPAVLLMDTGRPRGGLKATCVGKR